MLTVPEAARRAKTALPGDRSARAGCRARQSCPARKVGTRTRHLTRTHSRPCSTTTYEMLPLPPELALMARRATSTELDPHRQGKRREPLSAASSTRGLVRPDVPPAVLSTTSTTTSMTSHPRLGCASARSQSASTKALGEATSTRSTAIAGSRLVSPGRKAQIARLTHAAGVFLGLRPTAWRLPR